MKLDRIIGGLLWTFNNWKQANKSFQLLDDYISLTISIFSTLFMFINFKIILTGNFLFIYFILDLCLFKKRFDIIVHHLIAIFTYYKLYNLYLPEKDFEILCKVIILLESSSIFLIIKKIIKDNKIICNNSIKFLINILFITTFIYYRIYHYYYYLLRYNQILDNMLNNYVKNYFDKYFFYCNFYGFYILNLYWAFLIFNKLLIRNK
jgi:hypothetical protein